MTAPAPAPKAASPKGRDRYLDTLRALAIFRVVTYHAFGFAWFPWMPAMGVMFALGGTLMVRSIDKSPKQAVISRFRRLLPVLWVFAAIWIPLMIWHDGAPSNWAYGENSDSPLWQLVFWLLPVGDPPGSDWGQVAWGVLWYLKTYLWFVALSPLLLKPFRKVPWLVLALPFALLGLAEISVLPLDDWWGSTANDVLVYLGCWLIGFAHAEGLIKKLPMPALIGIGVVIAGSGVAWLIGPAHEQIVEAGRSTFFLEGSSLSLALYSFGVVFILMRFSSRMEWLNKAPVVDRIITIFNSRAVTIYLWHNAALALAMGLADRVEIYPWYFWFPITWVLVGGFVLLFGWIEDVAAKRKPELLPGKRKAPAISLQPGSASPAPASPSEQPAGRASPAPTSPGQPPVAPAGAGAPVPPGPYPPAGPYAPAAAGYGDPRYGGSQPQYGGPQTQYGDPQYGDPRYGDPRYGDPRYGDPRYGTPPSDQRYANVSQHDPYRPPPRYDEPRHDQPRYDEPRYDEQRYDDPRYRQPDQRQQDQRRPESGGGTVYGRPSAAPEAQHPYNGDNTDDHPGYRR
ncbi:acyltransferase family protein [Cryptosporangium sp. NPDC051539]|uniref:acyltransferase family protein n=1 Tax=Cryptosporangium sp. NPDC051539 TaxID=3363962 RepID=UPI003793E522